jgi:ELWxxDGT repeat protein
MPAVQNMSINQFAVSLEPQTSGFLASEPRPGLMGGLMGGQQLGGQQRSVLFIDANVAAADQLIAGAQPGTSTYLLDAGRDGIAQMTEVLAGLRDVASVQILSHGRSGGLALGRSWLDVQTLPTYVEQLKSWAQALTQDADILLYGCNVAQGAAGTWFVNRLAEVTGADVAASADLTGSMLLGGNWDLEYRTGGIEGAIGVNDQVLAKYSTVLDVEFLKNLSGASAIYSLASVNSNLYFITNDSTYGTGLWKSNGTSAGTALIKIIDSEASTLAYSYSNADVNGTVYFSFSNQSNVLGLWKSDGTAAGTSQVPGVVDPSNLTNVNGTLYYSTKDKLWKLNGANNSPTVVKTYATANPNPLTSISPSGLVNVNGTLFFTGYDDTNGRALWKSNGTTSGTVLVKKISPREESLTSINGTLYFSADDGVHGEELWKSDGTAAGTVLVKDIYAGAGNSCSYASDFTNVNGTLYFAAYDETHGRELWKSDGTAAGTVLVKDIYNGISGYRGGFGGRPGMPSEPYSAGAAGDRSSYIRDLTNVNGKLYFTAEDEVHGRELWKSDGTAAGTRMVKDIDPTGRDGSPASLTGVNGKLFFTTLANGSQKLWQSDGTAEGTFIIDLNIDLPQYSAFGLNAVNGALLIQADKSFLKVTTDNFPLASRDAQPDLLLRNSGSGEVAIWGLGNTKVMAADYTQLANGTVIRPDGNWKMVYGEFDWNYDGINDLVWFNSATTETAIWYMQLGSQGIANIISDQSSYVYPYAFSNNTPDPSIRPIRPGGNWKLTTVFKDYNSPKFFWEDPDSGNSAIWTLGFNNGRVEVFDDSSSGFITLNDGANSRVQASKTGSGWKMIGVGNFDGDLRTTDMLWFNEKTTETAIWQLGGTTIVGSGLIKSNGINVKPGLGWKPVAIANVDGATTDEIIWQNGTTVAVWQMGANFTLSNRSTVLAQKLETGEVIQAIADLDLNGSLELVARRKTAGPDTTRLYTLNPSTFQITEPTTPRYIAAMGQMVPLVTGDGRWDIVEVADFGGPLGIATV